MQGKYGPGKCSLVGKNPTEQALINQDIRNAMRSHADTWFWNRGGIDKHIRSFHSFHINDVQELRNMMHDATMQLRRAGGAVNQEISTEVDLLELT